MGVKERRERDRLELRQTIVDAARDLFVKEGFDRVSMRRIAEAIEYSPTAIYLHFPDKDALFRAICREDFDRLAGAFLKLREIADPVERIRQIGLSYIQFGLQHPNHYRLMFMTPADVQPQAEDLARKDDPTHDAYALLKDAVTQAMKDSAFHSHLKDVELLAQTLWAGCHGVVSLQVVMADDPFMDWSDFAARADLMTCAILRGLVRPERWPKAVAKGVRR
jgi:AcrR family transcriptional regulator